MMQVGRRLRELPGEVRHPEARHPFEMGLRNIKTARNLLMVNSKQLHRCRDV